MRKKAVIFLGPPGAGKGTISALCEEKFNWKHLSTGNVCREHIQNQTDLGQEISSLIQNGKLVPDHIIMHMIERWITQHQCNLDGIIFDGTPRTLDQSIFVDKMLQDQFCNFEAFVVHFQVNPNVLMNRILSRIVCSNKSCQKVYSTDKTSGLYPKDIATCDACSNILVQRTDDSQETLKKRLDVYYQHEKDMLQYYKNQNVKIISINAEDPIDTVFYNISNLSDN